MRLAYLYAFLAVCCWVTGPVGSKAALLSTRGGAHLTPLQVAFWAILLGWVALLVQLLLCGRWRFLAHLTVRGWLIVAAMGLFGWTGYPVAINAAYAHLPLSEAMIISNLSPVLVMLLQCALFGRMVRVISGWEQTAAETRSVPVLRLTLGVLCCLVGVVVIATHGNLSELMKFHLSPGVFAALFAALAWAIYSNLGRFVTVHEESNGAHLSDVQNFGAMTVGLIVMAVALAATGEWRPPAGFATTLHLATAGSIAVNVWLIIITMAIFNYAVGYTLWLHALELGTQAGEAHALPPLTYLLLIFSIFAGWVLLREPILRVFWTGAAFIAAGNVISLWPSRRVAEMVSIT